MPLVPPYIAALRPYEAGRRIEEIRERYGLERVIKLASNENPLGPSPKAVEAATKAVRDINRYPDGGLKLRERLAAEFCTKVENVICGAGSDSLMANIIRTFLGDDDEVLTTEAAFGGFQTLAKSRGAAYRTVPYRDWRYDLPALALAITDKTKIVYLANPNNPTGTMYTSGEFDEFYRHVPERVLILLDEAYFEFARDKPAYPDSMSYRYDNVITLRTFSKVYGLAALRVGYGFAHEALIANVLKVKLPFEPSEPGQSAALAALDDQEHIERTLDLNRRGLRRLESLLDQAGLRAIPSSTNFVLVELDSPEEARNLVEGLLRQGVIVRPMVSTGLPQCVRISVGTEDEMEFFAQALDRVYSDKRRRTMNL